MPIQAILLAGGKGTRLAPLTDNLPKPLVKILDKEILLYVLLHLRAHGITNIAISTAHLGEMIEERFGDGAELGLKLTYLREPEPMGTGGWSQLVDWEELADDFLVINADNIAWIDLDAFLERHRTQQAIATIAGIEIPKESFGNYEILEHDSSKSRLLDYIDRSRAAEILPNRESVFVNSGWYAMTPRVKKIVENKSPISNEVDIWPALARSGQPLGFYHATEPWFDSGTHERLAIIEKFLLDNPKYV